MPQRKRKIVADHNDLSSDDDFQPSLNNKRQKRKKIENITQPKLKDVSQQTMPVRQSKRTTRNRHKMTETPRKTSQIKISPSSTSLRKKPSSEIYLRKTTKIETPLNMTVRVVLKRLAVVPDTRYSYQSSWTKDKSKGNDSVDKNKFVHRRSVISLPRTEKMVEYSKIDEQMVDFDKRKRNIDDAIDSSDDEQILIIGKPNRKKYKKEELSDSFLECFYLSSSDESSVIDTSSDSDIFASSDDDTTKEDPSERQNRYMKRETMQFHRFTSLV